MVEGEERCLAKSGKAYVASVLQGFHCMMVEGEERCLAKSDKAYVAFVLQGFHCMMVEGEERCLAKSKGRPHVPVSARTLSLLRRYYRDHNFK